MGPATTSPIPGNVMAIPTAAIAASAAPTVPPTAPPIPAPSAAFVPASTPNSLCLVESDMRTLTSPLVYPHSLT